MHSRHPQLFLRRQADPHEIEGSPRARAGRSRSILLLAFVLPGLLAFRCGSEPGDSGFALFESPIGTPIALSLDGDHLVSVNPLVASISIVDLDRPLRPPKVVPVGLDPVSVAIRPKRVRRGRFGWHDEWVFVVNHVSDSINIVSLREGVVKQTLQIMEDGVTRTNEPVGIVFDGPNRAFVTLDEANQVIRLEPIDPNDADGPWQVAPDRIQLRAQSPRAIAVQGRRLLVAAFESGNQSVFPACPPPGACQGCNEFPQCQVELPLGGSTGESVSEVRPIVRDPLADDRDLWIFDLDDLDAATPIQVVEGIGTLLYGMATDGTGRVFVSNTEARNHRNGLDALENRMFENRLTLLDCAGVDCSLLEQRDLEAAGARVPTPYAVDAAADGSLVVLVAAGSDGDPLPDGHGEGAGSRPNPGLFTLDREGRILGSVPVGAIPQGVLLGADPRDHQRSLAYVWSGHDYSVRVVDVSDPLDPRVVDVLLDDPDLALDPLPPIVRAGRKWFRSARGSTGGTFACESCHPNAGTDQLLWTINSREDIVVVNGQPLPDAHGTIPDPRNTMPVRGLRDTLPLHWDGVLGNPDLEPPGCSLDHRSERMTEQCFRHLVDASLAAVMCDPADCPETEGRTGAYDDTQRRAIASYMASTTFSPGPDRAMDDSLSDGARDGFQAINSVGCARLECHSLPLHTSPIIHPTLESNPGTLRGLWDRHILDSSGVFSGRAAMEFSNEFRALFFGSFPDNYDPEVGVDENSALNAFLTYVFFGVGRNDIMQYSRELSVGYSGMLGRQLSVSGELAFPARGGPPDAEVIAPIEALERAAREGRIRAVGHGATFFGAPIALVYEQSPCAAGAACEAWQWRGIDWWGRAFESESLLDLLDQPFSRHRPLTLRADLPSAVRLARAGFPSEAHRMPLLWMDYMENDPRNRPVQLQPDTEGRIRAFARFVSPGARVFVDGQWCETCLLEVVEEPVLQPGQAERQQPVLIRKQLSDGRIVDNIPDAVWITLTEGPVVTEFPAIHQVQVQNPNGYMSNDLPLTYTGPPTP